MSIVRLTGVVREVGALVILDRIDAAIAAGDRIGLVGPNGAGKTTLLRVVAGLDEPDAGEVGRKRGLTIGMLAQEANVDAAFVAAPSLRAAVRAGAGRLERLEAELRSLEEAGRVTESRYAELQHEFEARDGYSLDQRVEAGLAGMGFGRDQWDRPPTGLSGGEQTRAALVRLLLAEPELLLLDEPTNHLDLAAIEWLEDHLRRRHGALVVASHDRAFLDATAARIWELRERRITAFRGDYSAYARQRGERDEREAKDVEARATQIAREEELVQRYRSQRKFSKMHEHEARLAALDPLEKRRSGPRLRLPSTAVAGGAMRSGEVVVRAEGLAVGYATFRRAADGDGEAAERSERVVARCPWLELRRGERVGVVGPNGAGKTTLLRTIAGELPPLDGGLDLGRNVGLAYLAQLRESAIPGATVLDAVTDALPMTPGAARSHLARFLFRGDDVFKEVGALSGGERSRLELALLFLLPANLLLLDEPTNHLDIAAREALESFMRDTEATLLVVSHDRRLLETVCDRLWVVDDGTAVAFDGGYRAWRAAAAEGWTVAEAAAVESRRLHGGGASVAGRASRPASRRRAEPEASAVVAAGRAREGAEARADRAPAAGPVVREPAVREPAVRLSKDAYRRRKGVVEDELMRLTARREQLEAALQDPQVQGNFVELRRVSGELAGVQDALAQTEEAWLEVEEAAP